MYAPVFGNCWVYALVRVFTDGGKIVVHKSEYGWWPHMQHVDTSGCVTEYIPKGPKRKRVLPPPLFFGVVVTYGVLVEKSTNEGD